MDSFSSMTSTDDVDSSIDPEEFPLGDVNDELEPPGAPDDNGGPESEEPDPQRDPDESHRRRTGPTSQNGWKANDRSLIASYQLPGGKIAVRKGNVAAILLYVARRFHNEVEKLHWPGNWGYAERTIRGSSTTLSNHASGTAIDLNADSHPLGARGTFSAAEVKKIRSIVRDCDGVVRWGGDYQRRIDSMHFEINAGSAAVAALAGKIRAGAQPGVASTSDALPKPAPKPPAPNPKSEVSVPAFPLPRGHWYGVLSDNPKNHSGRASKDRPGIRKFQTKLAERGWTIGVDGQFGPQTQSVVRAFQKEKGLSIDGLVGAATWRAIWAAPVT